MDSGQQPSDKTKLRIRHAPQPLSFDGVRVNTTFSCYLLPLRCRMAYDPGNEKRMTRPRSRRGLLKGKGGRNTRFDIRVEITLACDASVRELPSHSRADTARVLLWRSASKHEHT